MKMNFQKIIRVFLSCTLLMGALAGCASNADKSSSSSAETTPSSTSEGTAEPKSSDITYEVGSDSKVLVVYYSATGNTEAVVNTISDTLGADIFELVPTSPYTSDDLNWSNKNSRVSKEHDNPDSRNVELTAATVTDWESYDTVFIGYPIWWGIAAWTVDGFIKANDFTGKTVIPFCTSTSSGLGESGELLAIMAGTGNWLEGERFRSGASDEDVSAWAKSVMQ